MNRIYSIVLLIFLYSVFPVFGQNETSFSFEKIATENIIIQKGLSQNSVSCVVQDDKGYLWFGTWDGLNCYNGYDFRIYNRDNGLCSQTINALEHDSYGTVWIGTEEGLNAYNTLNDQFSSFTFLEGDKSSISNNWVNDIYVYQEKEIWIGTSRGLNLYDIKTGTFKRYLSSPFDNTPFRSNHITDIIKSNDSTLWLGTTYGLLRLNLNNNSVTRYYSKANDFLTIPNNQIHSIESFNISFNAASSITVR